MTMMISSNLKHNTLQSLVRYLKSTLGFDKVIPIYSIEKRGVYKGIKVIGDFTINDLNKVNEYMEWEHHITLKAKPLDITPYEKGVVLYP